MRYLLVTLLFLSTFVTSAYKSEGFLLCDEVQTDTVKRPYRLVTVIDSIGSLPLRERFAYKDKETGARVKIIDDKSINLEKKKDVMVRGFRVRVYFDNNQNARQKSEAIVKDFETNYPEIPVFMHYAAPYFHVTVGEFLTYHEASDFMRRIISSYPKSFIVAEQMAISKFGSPEPQPRVDTIYLDSNGRDIIPVDSSKIEGAGYRELIDLF